MGFTPSERAFLAALLHRLPTDVFRRVRLLVAASTVWEILQEAGVDPAPEPSSTWADFLRSQADAG
ncbi:hypothetical protein SBI_09757 [Streptomyces bingchenggensis BCW-1]|uniref:Transposase n=1 Tax=Streptomyces bingchenggensis (strain BCW-1) TaxID=749414 RepID=D7CBJ8_STRBB|nr:hypothetical protein SBI_09757 [Streptomyces bingchenggensis BCW-1]